ncbi:MAG: ATP-dependent DNA helicase [Halioglobus sp.]
MTTELTIAITDLARFCHRSGDIDHRFTPSPTGEQGVAGHQRLYARRPPTYCSEYAVAYSHCEQDLRLILRGRADGYDQQQGFVEEIKTCRVAPESIPQAVSRLHMAQGRLYAAIIAAQCDVEALEVRLTWFNIDTDQQYSLSESCTRAELAFFLDSTLEQFSSWLRILARLKAERDLSLTALAFPYGGFRQGQRALAELTYKCIDQGGQLLLEAPTGIGKTAAVLFPALKALATGKHERVAFVTAKTVGRRAAEETLLRFVDAGYRGTALSLTAKDKICLSPGRACHGDDCPYARSYYDKLPEALRAAIQSPALRREDIEALAQRFEVCPYQLALDLLPWVDMVIADLHYIYSLGATLSNVIQSDDKRWTVLLDEAHNLPGRARDMYSARLGKADLMAAKAVATDAIARTLGRLNRLFLALQKEQWQEDEFDSRALFPDDLLRILQEFCAATSEQLAQEPTFLQRLPVLKEFFFGALQFMRVAEQWGEDYRMELSRGAGKQSFGVFLNCLDPARLLSQRQQHAHSVTAFSATLSPLPWTSAALGLAQDAVCTRATSPFSRDQLQVFLATDIDTRYRQRDASLPDLVKLLLRWLQGESGNCIVYFPSYRYMQDCLAQLRGLEQITSSRTLWEQRPEQDDSAREQLLQFLAQRRDVVAFCILGGVFGEGIDLPGEQLRSVVVVGVGMPQVNRDTRQLQSWYQQRYGSGFEYTFVYPGMQKVDQALGRVVRCLQDRGRALLIDPRYAERQYAELLPPWWDYAPWPESR